MKRVVAIALSLITSATLVTACDYSPPGPPVEQAVGVSIDAPRVKVVSHGAGEKQLLAFADIDQEQSVQAEIAQSFSQDVVKATAVEDYQPLKTEEEVVLLPLEAEVSPASAAAEGQVAATRNVFVTIGEPEGENTSRLSSAQGFQFGWRAVDSGQISSLRLAAPKQATDKARNELEKTISTLISQQVVLPTEPVAPGASWEVDSRVAGDSALLQTTTYTLEAVEGDQITLGVEIERRPSLGALELPDGQTLKVVSTTSDSRGKLELNLKNPLPTGGTVETETRITYGHEDSEIRVIQTTATRLAFTAVE